MSVKLYSEDRILWASLCARFRAVQLKTEGMAASVRVFFEQPSYFTGGLKPVSRHQPHP